MWPARSRDRIVEDPGAQFARALSLARSPSRKWIYGLTPVVLTVAIRWLLEPMLEDKSPFLLFTFAVMLAATLGGVSVGAAGTAIGAIAGLLFLADTPQGAFDMFRSGRFLQLMLYLAVCGGMTYLIDALSRLRQRAEIVAAQQGRLAEELRQADRAKDDFLATLSHELRTPLTAIVGWADALKSGRLSEDAAAKAVETIDRNARIQAQLIADMLDVARIASGKLRLDPRPVTAAEVVAAAIETITPAARARNIELHEDCDPGAVVWGDPDRLQQVVWNLLSNAVKFTPTGGRVAAKVHTVDGQVHITIADSGPGLRSEFVPHVFERFRQDGESGRSPGLGLGLAIVKRVVEVHGGSVSAGNRSDGPGALFEVVIPVLAGVRATRGATDLGGHARPKRVLSGLHVLVVDDDGDTRDLLGWILEDFGAEVVTAGSVPEAVTQLGKRRPDVILADLAMPGEDGYSLLRKLRAGKVPGGHAIPTAALSAGTTDHQRARALEAGFAMHLAKPVIPDQLAAAVLALTDTHAT